MKELLDCKRNTLGLGYQPWVRVAPGRGLGRRPNSALEPGRREVNQVPLRCGVGKRGAPNSAVKVAARFQNIRVAGFTLPPAARLPPPDSGVPGRSPRAALNRTRLFAPARNAAGTPSGPD